MRFRLSTLLTSVALASLSIGWATDHVRQDRKLLVLQQETESKLELVERGTCYWWRAYDVTSHAESRQKLPDQQDEAWRYRLLATIVDVWFHEDAIQYAKWGAPGTAQGFCQTAMELLEFDSTDDFFEAASGMFANSDKNYLPHIFDRSSKEYKALASFIADSLDPAGNSGKQLTTNNQPYISGEAAESAFEQR